MHMREGLPKPDQPQATGNPRGIFAQGESEGSSSATPIFLQVSWLRHALNEAGLRAAWWKLTQACQDQQASPSTHLQPWHLFLLSLQSPMRKLLLRLGSGSGMHQPKPGSCTYLLPGSR